ncbi:hypothetical protein K402DRAFT_380443 [Aulographum hederae CBS 113979]|uniref:Arylformamidase n=1 Tax=Aulographum hederae CBS 113979 TaxID=1176131 RepID=A0A6G1GUR4_9PEZI|nr:hypothetical protein K402DRAFT_380443 [Aulographum hederae CBS 113979]
MPPTQQKAIYRNNIAYGDEHRLQLLDICLPRPLEESSPEETVWVVYLHGGAYRDPLQNRTELHPALTHFFPSPSTSSSPIPPPSLSKIAGFASIDYALSPRSPADLDDAATNAVHPRHVNDVLKGLRWLGREYGRGHDYILVGHSCGGTIAFQVALSQKPWTNPSPSEPSQTATTTDNEDDDTPSPPISLLSLAGLHNLPLLATNHISIPFYATFLAAAFGPSRAVWEAASPTSFSRLTERWEGGRLVVLGWSGEDGLVEGEQREGMRGVLRGQGWVEDGGGEGDGEGGGNRRLMMVDLEGGHDEVWEGGMQLCKVIALAVEELFKQY